MDEFGSWAKIVIVEDDTALADIYKTRLELIGYICFVAEDGIEAIVVIERERPSLVLLDIMMPKLSGDILLEVMRRTDWGKDTKVLIISNLNESDAPPTLRTHGIEDYIVKANMTDDQIDQLVNKILNPGYKTAGTNGTTPEPTEAK